MRYGHQIRGDLTFRAGVSAGVKRTVLVCRGGTDTGFEKRRPSMAPLTTPETGRSVAFSTSAVTVSFAASSDGRSRSGMTCGFLRARGPLSVR